MSSDDRGGSRFARSTDDLALTGADALLRRSWWAIAVRGGLAILLGIFMLTRPVMTLSVFVAILGAYLFFDGVFTLVAAFHSSRRGRSWWPYVLEGLLSVVVGLWAFTRPTSMMLLLLILIAVRAIVVGLVEIGTGVSVKRTTGTSTWLLWMGGLASVVFGVMLLRSPAFGLALVWMVGFYAIIFGVLMDAEAFHFFKGERSHHATTSA